MNRPPHSYHHTSAASDQFLSMNIEQNMLQDAISKGIIQAISHAVQENNLQRLKDILKNVEPSKRATLLNGTSVGSQPLLHSAVTNGQFEMVQLLLSNGANGNIFNYRGRTALHEAVRTGNVGMTRILLQKAEPYDEIDGLSAVELALDSVATLAHTGQLVNLKDQAGLTPLLLLADAASLTTEDFTAMVKLLIESGAEVDQVHPGNDQTALFRAVELAALSACSDLVGAGANIDVQDKSGDTVLHVAARLDKPSILQFLVQRSKKSINVKNNKGDTTLHCAAYGGSRMCLNILLNAGGDLSTENEDDEAVIEVLFTHLPRPATFLIETLDSKIIPNHCSINDRQFEMTIDFRILAPDRERQMDVVVALMNALRSLENKKVLQHPLIETYLRFRWTRMQIFFFGLFFIHLIFVLTLSAHVIWLLYPEQKSGVIWSRRALLASASLLLIHIAIQTSMAPKYFLREPETWLSLTCVSIAFIMSFTGEFIVTVADEDWIRHVASYTILFSWGQIMFVLGRFPSIGFFALMFFTVLKNVLKVLLIFACLVIGFALSFCVQFNSFEYEGPFRAFLRTTVMLMGEYDYQSLFAKEMTPFASRWDHKPLNLYITSQLIFLMFILLGSVVLMNLMIGMAVNDIQELQADGNLRHMMKQAEFLLHMDRMLSNSRYFKARKAPPTIVTINPTTLWKMKESRHKRQGFNVPKTTIEKLVKIALRNQRRDSEGSQAQLSEYQNSQQYHYNGDFEVPT